MIIRIPSIYVAVDIETTGRASWDRITEIGAIRYENGQETGRFVSLANAGHKIPEEITRLTGITNEMIADAPPIAEVIEKFAEFIGGDYILGYNFRGFDARYIDDAFRRYLGRPLSNPVVDALPLVKRASDPGERCRLEDATARYGIQHTAHRAAGDCEATHGVFMAAVEALKGDPDVEIVRFDVMPGAVNLNYLADWKTATAEMLRQVAAACGLKENELRLETNENKKKTSYSIVLAEREYPEEPAGVEVLYNVTTITENALKSDPDVIEMTTRAVQYDDTEKYLPRNNSRQSNGNLRLDRTDPAIIPYLRANAVYCVQRYESKAGAFACCSQFTECSNAGHCVHPNRLYSQACQYRQLNLDSGRIFYGPNRNIDDNGRSKVFTINGQEFTAENAFPGSPSDDPTLKAARRLLGLPITKQLKYYRNSKDPDSAADVDRYQIIQLFDTADTWATVRVKLVDGGVYMIHSTHLAEMQKPTYIDDMARAEQSL